MNKSSMNKAIRLWLFLWLVTTTICGVKCQAGKPPPAAFYLDTRGGSRKLDLSTSGSDEGKATLNDRLPIKFIIHGWTENANKTYYIDMSRLLLKREECNVFRVDYTDIASQQYIMAATSYGIVGNYVGDFIAKLINEFHVPHRNIHVIGHSLGGQVSGCVGRRVYELTGERIYRISALDPAAPLFEKNLEAYKLTRKDAEFVDIVHTDGGVLGYWDDLGTVDFYPNGGKRLQPGCQEGDEDSFGNMMNLLNTFYCSHHKSIVYYSVSILKNSKAIRCSSWRDFRNGRCDQNERIEFGYNAPPNATGSYYFEIDYDDEYIRDILLSSGKF